MSNITNNITNKNATISWMSVPMKICKGSIANGSAGQNLILVVHFAS
jgi:hypothetical protein